MSNSTIDDFINEILEIESKAINLKKNAELGDSYLKDAKKIEDDTINKILNLVEERTHNDN